MPKAMRVPRPAREEALTEIGHGAGVEVEQPDVAIRAQAVEDDISSVW